MVVEGRHLQVIVVVAMAAVMVEGVMAFLAILSIEVPLELLKGLYNAFLY